MNERWWFALAIVAVLGMGAYSHRWPSAPAPSKREPCTAEAWMIDALPGIGSIRLSGALAAVRSRHFTALPAPARVCAEKVFAARIPGEKSSP